MGVKEEQFLETDYVKDIIAKYKRSATVLHPQTSNVPLSIAVSKFGGTPNLMGFDTYPYCDCCNTALNFVLQLYKDEFTELYFPEDKNLFQLFRCPNGDCPDAYPEEDYYDLKRSGNPWKYEKNPGILDRAWRRNHHLVCQQGRYLHMPLS